MATNTKEHILEVAFSLFLQKSFKAVTIREIVEKSGVSKGAFYHYFESKNELFIAVFKNYYSDVLEDNFSKFNQDSLKDFYMDVLEYSHKLFKKLFKTSGKKTIGKANHFLMLFEAAHRNPKFRKLVNREGQKEIEAWKKVVEKAQENGEITSKIAADKIAKMFIFIGDGHGMHNSLEKRSDVFDIKETKKLYDSLYELVRI